MRSRLSRRAFLSRIGAAGGSAAVYQASIGLGLIPGVAETAPRASLAPLGARKRSVVILGAGLSGLACAYELERAGYDCTVIEATGRIGGRNLTVRAGDVVDEMGHRQRCEFDDHPDLYMNAGPARIPAHHRLLLDYCNALGVELEVFVNDNRHAWVHDPDSFGGRPVRMREYVADARGFMTELLAKSVNRADFEAPLTGEDAQRLFEFLRAYGDLDENGIYRGSSRAGYASGGMVEPPGLKTPFDFSELLSNDFWRYRMHWGEGEDQTAPMMQAVGGNDHIVRAFAAQIDSRIVLEAPVQRITVTPEGVAVVYARNGRTREIRADYCLNSIPAHLLPGVQNNFSRDYLDAMASVGRGRAMKIGLQMSERFWEAEHIYGGITWTSQPVEQLWYPSHGIHGDKGVMLGAYIFDPDTNDEYARLDPAQRIRVAVEQGSKVHPGYADYVESGVAVAWHRMNFMMGCGAQWTPEARQRWYRRMQQPEGRHYLMGDQVSFHPGWQEGALSSAHFALAHLNERVSAQLDHA